MGSPPVRSSRWDVADQTSRVPSTSRPSTASMRIRSMPGVRRLRARTGAVVTAGSFRARGLGGRIEPSGWNDGSASGATTPGISASLVSTCEPCDAVQRLPDLADVRPGGARAGAALGDHHQHDVVLVVGRDPRRRLLAVDLGRPGLGADVDPVEREADHLPRHGADLGGAQQRVGDVGDRVGRVLHVALHLRLDPPHDRGRSGSRSPWRSAARRACRRWRARRTPGRAGAA